MISPTSVESMDRVHAARERAIARLTDRYGDGTLDDAALDFHLARLHAASSTDAVARVLADIERPLPAPLVGPTAPEAVPAYAAYPSPPLRRILGLMSATRRSGQWAVPRELRVIAVMSDVKLDFRHAVIPPVVEVDVTCVMGDVHMIVPPGLPVVFEADGVLGTATSAAIEPMAASAGPVIRVSGTAFLGEIRVVVKERAAR